MRNLKPLNIRFNCKPVHLWRKFPVCLFAGFCALLLFASIASKANSPLPLPSGIGTNWVKYTSTDGVDIYYEISTCNGDNVVYINFDNTNAYDVKIEWQDSIEAIGHWVASSANGAKSVEVSSGTATSNSCSGASSGCSIFSKNYISIPNAKISGFKISTLKISKL